MSNTQNVQTNQNVQNENVDERAADMARIQKALALLEEQERQEQEEALSVNRVETLAESLGFSADKAVSVAIAVTDGRLSAKSGKNKIATEISSKPITAFRTFGSDRRALRGAVTEAYSAVNSAGRFLSVCYK